MQSLREIRPGKTLRRAWRALGINAPDSHRASDGFAIHLDYPVRSETLEPNVHHILDPIWDRFARSATATNGLSFWIPKA